MTILVTGASGFLGSHVAEQLSQAGRPVRALVRKSSNTKFLSTLPHVEFAYGSVEDRDSVMRAAEGVTGIIHSAGLVKARSSDEFRQINTEGTENLIAAARRQLGTLKRFVFVSSQAAGGPSDKSGTPVRVGHETAPVTAYGRSKLAAEKALQAATDVPSVIVRPAAIVGPRDPEVLVFFKAVASGVLPLTTDPEAILSAIYGPDAAAACIKAIDANVPAGSVYYLDDGHPAKFGVWVEAIEEALGKRAWLRLPLPKKLVRAAAAATMAYGKVTDRAVMFTLDKCNELQAPGWVCDSAPARRDLGWEPQVGFKEAVKLTASWYRQAGWL